MTAREIAALVGGELIGDGDRELDSGQTLDRAGESQLAFWERRRDEQKMPLTNAGCVIVDYETRAPSRTLIRSRHPRRAFAQAMRAVMRTPAQPGRIDASATVSPTAAVAEDVSVGPFSVVEAGASIGRGTFVGAQVFVGKGAVVGQDCRLYPGAKIFGNARLGARVILHGGAVIGADGFGLIFESDHYEKFPQIGGVEIGNDVEIGANSCVDRGALDDTRIGDGTKLDNLVHIGHNCQIGRHVVMAAQVGLSGSVIVEDYAVLGGQVGVGDRARIGAGAQLGGQTGLLPDKRLANGGTYWGTPARPLREQLLGQAHVGRLPRLLKAVKRMRQRIKELESS